MALESTATLATLTGQDIHKAYEHVKHEEAKIAQEAGIPSPFVLSWEGCSPQSRTLYEKMAAYLNTLAKEK